ncbi:MAG: hypothetical protein ACOCYP_01880 [Planctomycetota bacterium]
MSDQTHTPTDLIRALDAIARVQARWLADLEQVTAGEPRFLDAFRRWEETLSLLKVHIHRAEQRLLHYLLVPQAQRPYHDFDHEPPDRRARFAHWTRRTTGYFDALHIDTAYRRLSTITDPFEEAATADICTDLVALAVLAETTGSALERFANGGDQAHLEDLAFYHVLNPWKREGLPPLLDVLRWLNALSAERDEL